MIGLGHYPSSICYSFERVRLILIAVRSSSYRNIVAFAMVDVPSVVWPKADMPRMLADAQLFSFGSGVRADLSFKPDERDANGPHPNW